MTEVKHLKTKIQNLKYFVERYTGGTPAVVQLLGLAIVLYGLRLIGLALIPRAMRTTPLIFYGSLGLVFTIFALAVIIVAWRDVIFRRVVGLVLAGWRLAVLMAGGLGAVALAVAIIGKARIAPRTFDSDLTVRVIWGLGVALAAPLIEEFIFRGLLLAWLLEHVPRHFPRWQWPPHYLAIILAALAFALAHIGVNPLFLPVLFAGGVLYGWVRWQSGSLLPSLAGHVAWNSALVAGQVLYWLG